jgi:uncharacterized protein
MKYFVTSRISENISETPEGFLVCLAVPIARTGEMEYDESEIPGLDADNSGKIHVWRDEEEVFRPQTLASFEGKPITIRHPEGWVGPENWSELAKGTMQNIRRGTEDQKDSILADLLITDKMAIELVKQGLREVSCGYDCDYDQDDEEPGKAIQKNIIGNHLALVDQGRAGPEYAITDHKGEKNMTFQERIKALFGKAQDEALKIAEEAAKTKDERSSKKNAVGAEVWDEFKDELVKMVGDKIEELKKDQAQGMVVKKQGKAADDEEEGKEKEGMDDEEGDKEDQILSRLKVLETAIEKLLGKGKDDEEEMDDDDKESMDDEEEMDDDDMDDEDYENSSMVGDSAEVVSRAEILAPGLNKSKDLVVKSVKTFYATDDGKKVIHSLTGGKAPTFDGKKIQTLFIAASEIMKAKRTNDFSDTRKKQRDEFKSHLFDSEAMTPEKMNELNAKHYKA